MGPARPWIAIGAIAALIAVAMGAYAAHGLQSLGDPHAVELVNKAVRYQMTHGLALILCGILTRASRDVAPGWIRAASIAFLVGILLFCGTLYTLAFTDLPVAIVAPFGGTAFLIGWGLLAVAALRGSRPDSADAP